jgi:protein phosphatase
VGAHGDDVAIMRGIQGSFLGIRLQEPYQLGCLNDRNELSQISYDQAGTALTCELMRLEDLRPSERAQVSAGLPAGSLENAIGQLRELARGSLLPVCTPPPARPVTAPRTGSPAPWAPRPATPSTSVPAPAPTSPPPAPVPRQKPGIDCRSAA